MSLFHETGEARWLADAEALVADVYRVLGRKRGLRIGEAPDRDGQVRRSGAAWYGAP